MGTDKSVIIIAKAKAIAILIGALTPALISVYQSYKTEQKSRAGYEIIAPRIPDFEKTINEMKEKINLQQTMIENLQHGTETSQCRVEYDRDNDGVDDSQSSNLTAEPVSSASASASSPVPSFTPSKIPRPVLSRETLKSIKKLPEYSEL